MKFTSILLRIKNAYLYRHNFNQQLIVPTLLTDLYMNYDS